jgi:hypothetical protein
VCGVGWDELVGHSDELRSAAGGCSDSSHVDVGCDIVEAPLIAVQVDVHLDIHPYHVLPGGDVVQRSS